MRPFLIRSGLLAGLACSVNLLASPDLKAPNGVYERSLDCHAIVGADIVPAPGERLEDATIVIRSGVIEAIGTDVEIPAEARVWHAEDMVIYPGLVEPTLLVEMADGPSGVGAHWNKLIRSQVDLSQPNGLAPLADATRSTMRKSGYTVAAAHPGKGIFRGRGVVLPMAKDVIDLRPYDSVMPMSAGFDRGGWGAGGYPSSLMGVIALMRQTLMDSQWHAECVETWSAARDHMQPPPRRDSLMALQDVLAAERPILFETNDFNTIFRAQTIADEFGLDTWMLGNGDEYQHIDSIAALQRPFIIPVRYPEQPDLTSLDSADRVSLRTMQQWEQAPTNLRRLVEAEVDVCVTTNGLSKPSDVRAALRKAIKTGGLDETIALECITTRPARLLGIDHQVGRLRPGMAAHLLVCSGDLFEKGTTIDEVWVSGKRHDYDEDPMVELSGTGTFTSGDLSLKGSIDTIKKSFSVEVPNDPKEAKEGEEPEDPGTTTVKAKKVGHQGHRFWGVIDSRPWGAEGWARFGGRVDEEQFIGRGRLADGTPFTFTFNKSGEAETSANSDTDEAEASNTEADPITGTWMITLQIPGVPEPPDMTVVIERDEDTLSAIRTMMGDTEAMSDVQFDASTNELIMVRKMDQGNSTMTATIDGNAISGVVRGPFGEFPITGTRTEGGGDAADSGEGSESDDQEGEGKDIPEAINYPLGAFGPAAPPEAEDLRVEHATIWTCSDAGIIKDGGLLIEDGRVAWIGPYSDLPQTDGHRVIDATGLHITPGLIDCHSHTGINGSVNESSEACTAEVRIGDVVNPTDIGWYRQLAGGLTACNQLHGSANPIGGQNSVVKLKWGRTAEAFPISDAIPGIKFALGENVKRSSGRYPNTRMGVETFIRDRLTAARAYQEEWARWADMDDAGRASQLPPRRDIELDTLVEILNGERIIHCHSYRQDEILALLRTAEAFGFQIGTLQHILEGYKVADAIADHGAGASSFSDWWAYKIEVMDAIPYNGSIMRDVGVNVSFNSDDSELATRMNDEAAKAVRYGGVPRAEALCFVTINPAKQLRIDHRTGSLEPGKDADFVVWSEDPLSSYSRCLQTYIEGARYYDEAEDLDMRAAVAAERQRLTAKILAKAVGAPTESKTAESNEDEAPADGPHRRWGRGRRERPTDDFPYHDHDHRGVCGCNEVSR